MGTYWKILLLVGWSSKLALAAGAFVLLDDKSSALCRAVAIEARGCRLLTAAHCLGAGSAVAPSGKHYRILESVRAEHADLGWLSLSTAACRGVKKARVETRRRLSGTVRLDGARGAVKLSVGAGERMLASGFPRPCFGDSGSPVYDGTGALRGVLSALASYREAPAVLCTRDGQWAALPLTRNHFAQRRQQLAGPGGCAVSQKVAREYCRRLPGVWSLPTVSELKALSTRAKDFLGYPFRHYELLWSSDAAVAVDWRAQREVRLPDCPSACDLNYEASIALLEGERS